ncbi:MAG: SpoIIE family protein phosphatase [Anaerovoracaceae bacterium]|jgi:sigma-B regulation protein RsbU (phosphoserine phosphatase)
MNAIRKNINMPIAEHPHFLREIVDNMEYMARVIDENCRIIYMNRKMEQVFGNCVGNVCYNVLGKSERCEHCVSSECKDIGAAVTKEIQLGDKYYKVMSSPVNLDICNENYSIEIFEDITEKKILENQLMTHYEKMRSDIDFAKHIQKRSLPVDGDYWDTMRIDNIYFPSEDLSGDYYDIIKMDENRILLYVADVSGHGIKSSLITIFLRQLIRGCIQGRDTNVRDILNHVLESYNALIIDEEQFLSILICIYDKRTQKLTIANAGHNCLPILIKKCGEIKEIPVKGMPICSLINESDHEEVNVHIETGDRLLLYTDGITEAFNEDTKKLFGVEGIEAVVHKNIDRSGKELINKIIGATLDYVNKPPADDIAILCMEML